MLGSFFIVKLFFSRVSVDENVSSKHFFGSEPSTSYDSLSLVEMKQTRTAEKEVLKEKELETKDKQTTCRYCRHIVFFLNLSLNILF